MSISPSSTVAATSSNGCNAAVTVSPPCSSSDGSSRSLSPENAQYQEQRRQYLHSLYNGLSPTTPPLQDDTSSSTLHASSTKSAASQSFIRDSTSPLFKSIKVTEITELENGASEDINLRDSESKEEETRDIDTESTAKLKALDLSTNLSESNDSNHSKHSDSKPLNHPSPALVDRESNITQKQQVVPPKKMKKKASKEELQLVVNHFAAAEEKNIEGILKQHEPHVLEYRDKIYAQALNDGVTVNSDDMTRLKVLAAVVEYAFMNIEPPNEYTKVCTNSFFRFPSTFSLWFSLWFDIMYFIEFVISSRTVVILRRWQHGLVSLPKIRTLYLH